MLSVFALAFFVTGFAQKRCSKLIIDRFFDENHCSRELLDDVCLFFFVIFSSFIEFAVDSLLGFCKFSSFLFMYICLAGHVRTYAHTHTG